jgi:hypothetical protein
LVDPALQAVVIATLSTGVDVEAIDAEIVLRNVSDPDHAQRERFLGSPTVRVDGLDIDPGAEGRDDYGLKCRIYQTPAGLTGLPSDEWILDALTDHQEDYP